MQRLLDIMTGLRKVRESVPREEAIVNVLSERRDLVSSMSCSRRSRRRFLHPDIVCLHWLIRLRKRLQGSATNAPIPTVGTRCIK